MPLGSWVRLARRSALDVTLSIHPGLTTRIIEHPGTTLDDAALAALVGRLRTVAGRTLAAGGLTYGVFSGDRDRLSRVIVTVVADIATGRPIAFSALALMDVELHGEPATVMHLGLVMVDPHYRGRGLSEVLYGLTVLLRYLRGGMRPLWVSNVTQVPAVVGMVCRTFSNVFPSPDPGTRQSFTHLHLARQIMRRHRQIFGVGASAGFDEATGVITDAYTGGSEDLKKSFDRAAKHRKPVYNEFCRLQLDYDRGDDFLQLGIIDAAAARRYALSHLPRGSLPQLFAEAVFLVVQRLLLPIVHWFDDTQRLGSLRPRIGRDGVP